MDHLNDDILLLIFEHMNSETLIHSSKVCSRWKRLITSTAVLVRFPTLTLDISTWENDPNSTKAVLKKITKNVQQFPYRNFKLTTCCHFNQTQRNQKTLEILEKFSIKVEKLSIHSFSGELMLSMLSYAAPTLTHLIVTTHFPDKIIEGFVELPKLEYLRLRTVDSVLRIIKCVNLKTLDIDKCRDSQAIQIFLKNSQNLPKLKNLKTFKAFWSLENISRLPFELEELEVTNFTDTDPMMFHNFLLTQANSVRILRISEHLVSASTINFVLENIKNVQKFSIFGSIFNDHSTDLSIFPKNFSVRTLDLHLVTPLVRFPDIPELNSVFNIEKLLKKCQNLETLKFSGIVSTENQYRGEITLPKLKNLKVKDLKQFGFWHSLNLQNLEYFTMDTLNCCHQNVELLLDFLPRLPGLKHLRVNEWRYTGRDRSIMSSSDVLEFQKLLKNYETFRIKKCEMIPIRFLKCLESMDSEKFKLVEIGYEEDNGWLDMINWNFKSVSFQTNFKQLTYKTETGKWEKDVQYFEENEEYEWGNERVKFRFKSFMGIELYPRF